MCRPSVNFFVHFLRENNEFPKRCLKILQNIEFPNEIKCTAAIFSHQLRYAAVDAFHRVIFWTMTPTIDSNQRNHNNAQLRVPKKIVSSGPNFSSLTWVQFIRLNFTPISRTLYESNNWRQLSWVKRAWIITLPIVPISDVHRSFQLDFWFILHGASEFSHMLDQYIHPE